MEDEVRRLITVLAGHPNQRGANVIRMLLLTGARKGEVTSAASVSGQPMIVDIRCGTMIENASQS